MQTKIHTYTYTHHTHTDRDILLASVVGRNDLPPIFGGMVKTSAGSSWKAELLCEYAIWRRVSSAILTLVTVYLCRTKKTINRTIDVVSGNTETLTSWNVTNYSSITRWVGMIISALIQSIKLCINYMRYLIFLIYYLHTSTGNRSIIAQTLLLVSFWANFSFKRNWVYWFIMIFVTWFTTKLNTMLFLHKRRYDI